MDLAPIWSRPFTLLLVSRTITRFGSIVTSTTVLLHVAHLTESPFATGSVAAVQLLPLLALGLYGGHLADRFDRRRPALISETTPMLVATLLCGTSMLQQPSMTVLHVLVAASSALASVQRAALVIGGGPGRHVNLSAHCAHPVVADCEREVRRNRSQHFLSVCRAPAPLGPVDQEATSARNPPPSPPPETTPLEGTRPIQTSNRHPCPETSQ